MRSKIGRPACANVMAEPSRTASARRRLASSALWVALSGAVAAAQDSPASPPPDAPHGVSNGTANPTDGLHTVDFAFNYDQPAFYELLERLRTGPFPPADAAPVRVDDWRSLLSRPADMRGRLVQIQGLLGRNKDSFRLQSRPEWGWLTQLELTQPGSPVTATAICPQDVSDVPLGAEVTLLGYFVMARSYYADSGRVAHSVVLVVGPPLTIATPKPPAPAARNGLAVGFVTTLLAALGVTWWILRRAMQTPRVSTMDVHATEAAPFSLADELQKAEGWSDSGTEPGRPGGQETPERGTTG